MSKELTGYNMSYGRRLKKEGKSNDAAKNRIMAHVRIDKSGSRYVAVGNDKSFPDDKISVIVSAERANQAIKDGVAKKGDGWDEDDE